MRGDPVAAGGGDDSCLTQAERNGILAALRRFEREDATDDASLIRRASERVSRSPAPPQTLIRDVVALSAYLRRSASPESAALARGALLFITADPNAKGVARSGDGADAFMTAVALSEIREQLREQARYDPPGPSESERRAAEDLLLRFVENPISDDSDLVRRASHFCDALARNHSWGVLARLQRDVRLMIGVLRAGGTNEEISWSRAALSYLLREDDAVDDRLGLVGLLDDAFVADIAADIVSRGRLPWRQLLDDIVARWPFVNDLMIDDGTGQRPLSEFLVLNAAFVCPALQRSEAHLRAVALPTTGATPFIVAVVNALADLGELLRGPVPFPFAANQKVMVDGDACAIFERRETMPDGSTRLRLRQPGRERGREVSRWFFVPLEEMYRLAPADEERAPRGPIRGHVRSSEQSVSALQMLFRLATPVRFAAVHRPTVLVARSAETRRIAEAVRINGEPLLDVVPIARAHGSGDLEPWGKRGMRLPPALVVCDDLDLGSEYVLDDDSQPGMVILDLDGRNARKTASLRAIANRATPVVAYVSDHEREILDILHEVDAPVWHWTRRDLSELVWSDQSGASGPVSRYEARLRCSASGSVTCIPVAMQEIEVAAGKLAAFRSTFARTTGPESESDLVLEIAGRLLYRLMRATDRLDAGEIEQIEVTLRAAEARIAGQFVAGDERAAGTDLIGALRSVAHRLAARNPKSEALEYLRRTHGAFRVLLPGSSEENDDIGEQPHQIAIPGWFGRARMRRLLHPPCSERILLILYAPEQALHEAFLRHHSNAAVARDDRSRFFARFTRPPDESSTTPRIDPGPQSFVSQGSDPHRQGFDPDDLTAASLDRRCRRLLGQMDGPVEDRVEARLVSFSGGSMAFLTRWYEAAVVTRLVRSSGHDVRSDGAEVVRATVADLEPGEIIAFISNSDRGTIRARADLLLPSGSRTMANVWQQALLRYASATQSGPSQIWAKLRASGCTHHLLTVKRWMEDEEMIAPRHAHDHELKIIADATGDAELRRSLDECLAAISTVWGAHLRASQALARELRERALKSLGSRPEFPVHVGDVILDEVESIDSGWRTVDRRLVNRVIPAFEVTR